MGQRVQDRGVTLQTIRRYSTNGAIIWTALVALLGAYSTLFDLPAVPNTGFTGVSRHQLDIAVLWLCGLIIMFVAAARAQRRARERDAALMALLASEQRLRQLMRDTQAPIAVAHHEAFVFVNPAFCRLLGYAEPAELIGQSPRFNIAAADLELVADRYARRLRGEDVPANYEARLVRKDGSEIWVEISAQLTRYQDAPAVLAEMHDIHQRKVAETALVSSEERYRALIETMNDWVWEIDINADYTYVSPRIAALLGYSPEEVIGRSAFSLMPPAEAERLEPLVRHTIETQGVFSLIENTLLAKDGREVAVETSGRPFFDHSGKLLGYRGVDREVTERKRAQEALRHSEKQFRTLVENMREGIILADANGKIQFVNPAAAQMVKRPPAQLAGTAVFELTPASEHERLRTEMALRMVGEASSYETRMLRSDGSLLEVQVNATPRYDEAGNFLGPFILALDITQRREAEQALLRRDRLLEATAQALAQLWSIADLGTAINAALATLGTAVGVDRVYIFENHTEPQTGASLMSQRYEWCSSLATPQIDNLELQGLAYGKLPGWFEQLTTGRSINGLIREFPELIRPLFEAEQIKSILIMPIHLQGRFWGFIGFDDCQTERSWASADEHIISAVAVGIGQAYNREQTKQELEANAERFRGLVEGTSDLIAATDAAGRITYVNPVAELLLELDATALLGRRLQEFIQPDDLRHTLPVIEAQAAAGQRHLVFECRAVGAQGATHNLLWSADLQANSTGVLDNAYVIAHNITEHIQAKEAARLNAVRLEALQRLDQMAAASEQELCDFALEQAVFITRSELGYLAFVSEDESQLTMYAWNKQALAECGIEQQQVIYQVAETVLWDDAIRQRGPVVTNNYAAAGIQERGLPQGHVTLHRHMIVPVFDGGRIVALAGVGNKPDDYDETDVRQLSLLMSGMWRLIARRRALEDLQDREAQLRAFAEQPLVGFVILHSGKVVYANQAVCLLSGYSLSEFLGWDRRLLAELVQPDDFRRVIQGYRDFIQPDADSHALQIEFQFLQKAGATRWVLMHATRTLQAGQPAEIILVTDITDRKAAEAALQQKQREESIITLAGGIAHDFNNILLGVLGSSTLLADSLPPAHDGRELCDMISTSARRMSDLTSKLLAYARGGHQQLMAVDVTTAVQDALAMARGSQPSNIQVRQVPGVELWAAEADPGQLRQVLLNLIFNAFEAMAANGGLLTILSENAQLDSWTCAAQMHHAAGDYVHIAVSDTGAGMDSAILARVFEPYFSTKAQGRGLGLAAVQGIVRHHGGCITCQSTPGAGTTFDVYFQRSKRVVESAKADAQAGRGGYETLLLVDDEEIVLQVGKRILERQGYRVYTARDGQEALALVQQQQVAFGLALVDVQMPVLDGAELCARLRAGGYSGKLLLSSGFSETPGNAAHLPDQIDGYLHKPYSSSELLAAIRGALDGVRQEPGGALPAQCPDQTAGAD